MLIRLPGLPATPLILLVAIAAALLLHPTPRSAAAGVDDLRITEVRTDTGQVEVTHMSSTSFTSPEIQYCHLFQYGIMISSGTSFGPNERKVFTVPGLVASDSDLWMYKNITNNGDFGTGGNLVHGVKWGPSPNVGRTSLAVSQGKWSGTSDFVPAPGAGRSIVNETGSFDAADWYVDGSPNVGGDNVSPVGTVSSSLAWPAGVQDFEALTIGDEVLAIQNWTVVNTGPAEDFTIRAVDDAPTTTGLPGTETQWMRVIDKNATTDQNRFYSGAVTSTGTPDGYTWTFYVLVEELPAGGAANVPRLTIQHDTTTGFQNAWGIEIGPSDVNLVVTGVGGTAASSMLGAASTNNWMKLDLSYDRLANEVIATLNNGPAVRLATSLAGTANVDQFRFCYRGEGTGNTVRMLLDRVEVAQYTQPPNTAPMIAVDRNSSTTPTTVAQNGTLMVAHNSLLTDLDLEILCTDGESDPLTVSTTITNLGTTGILESQFGTGGSPVAQPVTLNPTTGTFADEMVTHVVTITADDGQAQTSFSFSIQVAAAVTNAPPTIVVQRDTSTMIPTVIVDNQIIEVDQMTTLAALDLGVIVSDPDGDDVSIMGTVSNVTCQNIDNGEFSRNLQPTPYTLMPTSGLFELGNEDHVFTLEAQDAAGNMTSMTFTVRVIEVIVDDPDGNDDGGCVYDTGAAGLGGLLPILLFGLLGLTAILRMRRG